MLDLVERPTSDCKHLNTQLVIRLRTGAGRVTDGDHDSIGNQSFKWDTHRSVVVAAAKPLTQARNRKVGVIDDRFLWVNTIVATLLDEALNSCLRLKHVPARHTTLRANSRTWSQGNEQLLQRILQLNHDANVLTTPQRYVRQSKLPHALLEGASTTRLEPPPPALSRTTLTRDRAYPKYSLRHHQLLKTTHSVHTSSVDPNSD